MKTRTSRREPRRFGLALVLCLGFARSGAAQSYSVVHGFESTGSYRGLIKASDGYLYGTSSNGGAYGTGGVFKMDTAGNDFSVIHSFSGGADIFPLAPLIQAADGYLYGTTAGGLYGSGTVFRLSTTGDDYAIIHVFGVFEEGGGPRGLLQAADGYLYGTTFFGGPDGFGTIFKLDTSGSGYSIIHSFDGTDGGHPASSLTQGSDGYLYGTSVGDLLGGNLGTAFRLDTSGGNFAVIHAFTGADGDAPWGGVIEVAGHLYGTTSVGGANGAGTIFRLAQDGGNFSVLHSFNGSDGESPVAALFLASDGFLHGATSAGGAAGLGAVFKLETAGSGFAVTHSFTSSEGALPTAPLIEATVGFLYGTTAGGGAGTVFRLDTAGGAFSNIHSNTTGTNPNGALIQDSGGNFYGTAASGGPIGAGVVFRLDALGNASAIHEFNYSDGRSPLSALVLAPDGYLYGTASSGGTISAGTVFKLDTSGNGFSVLHDFTGSEGQSPGGLVLGDDGFLYGLTTNCGGVCGTIYKLDTNGDNFEVIHDFLGSDGLFPMGALMQGSDGLLYGSTFGGGAVGLGTVFKLDTSGDNFVVIHDFAGVDGSEPMAALIEGADGYLYGTTFSGGAGGGCDVGASGCGTVFRLDTAGGNFSVLHDFTGSDGTNPRGGVIQASDGILYGAAQRNACSSGSGTVFRLYTDGSGFAVLHRFSGPDGANPSSSLLQASDGALYGTASSGGSLYGGVVLRVALDSSFQAVNLAPSSGAADGGTQVTISGAGFQSGALVTVGGEAATGVLVNGPNEIFATTPSLSPGTLNDILITNPDATLATMPGLWLADFTDVPQGDIFHDSVAQIFRNAITAGCAEGMYCRDNPVTRAQIAVFLLKAEHGSCYLPPTCTGVFQDVECTPDPAFAVDWIEQLYDEGITGGCGGGNYCPDGPVTRAQMAVFLLKAEHGSSYAPPSCAGIFDDVACPSLFADWIEQLAAEGITGGCGGGDYCPEAASTRGQMAVFLVKTFGL